MLNRLETSCSLQLTSFSAARRFYKVRMPASGMRSCRFHTGAGVRARKEYGAEGEDVKRLR